MYKRITKQYIAGFFDGEGSVGIYTNGKKSLHLRTQLVQGKAGCHILYELKSRFGGNVTKVKSSSGEFFAKKSLTQDVLDDNLVASLVTEEDEWSWNEVGDPVPHIDLKNWADVLVIAPLSANTLTKMAVGICNNLLTSMYYAWPKHKPIIVAPAMNTDMWNNPLTQKKLG